MSPKIRHGCFLQKNYLLIFKMIALSLLRTQQNHHSRIPKVAVLECIDESDVEQADTKETEQTAEQKRQAFLIGQQQQSDASSTC